MKQEGNGVKLKDLFKTAHHLIEAKEGRDITQSVMAKRLGVSGRSYAEYLNGGSEPLAAKAVLCMLNQLNDEEILKLIRASNKGANL